MGLFFLETGNSFQDPEKCIFDRHNIVFFSTGPIALPIRLLVNNGDVEGAVGVAG